VESGAHNEELIRKALRQERLQVRQVFQVGTAAICGMFRRLPRKAAPPKSARAVTVATIEAGSGTAAFALPAGLVVKKYPATSHGAYVELHIGMKSDKNEDVVLHENSLPAIFNKAKFPS
jgi:hypothetical protein